MFCPTRRNKQLFERRFKSQSRMTASSIDTVFIPVIRSTVHKHSFMRIISEYNQVHYNGVRYYCILVESCPVFLRTLKFSTVQYNARYSIILLLLLLYRIFCTGSVRQTSRDRFRSARHIIIHFIVLTLVSERNTRIYIIRHVFPDVKSGAFVKRLFLYRFTIPPVIHLPH